MGRKLTVTVIAPLLCAGMLHLPSAYAGQARDILYPNTSASAKQLAADEDIAVCFERLSTGMTQQEVMSTMARNPGRREISSYLGVEIIRLTWANWWSGDYYQVVLVAGHVVSKVAQSKSFIG